MWQFIRGYPSASQLFQLFYIGATSDGCVRYGVDQLGQEPFRKGYGEVEDGRDVVTLESLDWSQGTEKHEFLSCFTMK